jgi:hypothetical protein
MYREHIPKWNSMSDIFKKVTVGSLRAQTRKFCFLKTGFTSQILFHFGGLFNFAFRI